jgi:hypothetical protein
LDTELYSNTVMDMKRLVILTLMALVTLNIWTGAPLLALWVGSRLVRDHGQITMGAAAAVVVTLGATCLALLAALGRLTARYDDITGRPPRGRREAPWLRSLRGERPHPTLAEQPLRPVERIVIAVVLMACTAFEVWFFFFAGSPLGPA